MFNIRHESVCGECSRRFWHRHFDSDIDCIFPQTFGWHLTSYNDQRQRPCDERDKYANPRSLTTHGHSTAHKEPTRFMVIVWSNHNTEYWAEQSTFHYNFTAADLAGLSTQLLASLRMSHRFTSTWLAVGNSNWNTWLYCPIDQSY